MISHDLPERLGEARHPEFHLIKLLVQAGVVHWWTPACLQANACGSLCDDCLHSGHLQWKSRPSGSQDKGCIRAQC